MVSATTSQTQLIYIAESQWGETPPSPTMQMLRLTGESLSYDKQTEISAEITADRSRRDMIETAVSASGEVNFELSYGDYDTLIAAALFNTYDQESISGASLDFAGATIIGPGGGTFDNLFLGQWVKISGAVAANNGIYKISDILGETLTLAGASFATQTTAAAVIDGKRLINGATRSSFSIEKQFLDVSQYALFSGLVPGGFTLNVAAGQIVTGAVSFTGKVGGISGSTTAASVTAATENTSFVGGISVGDVEEGGATLTTALQSISLSAANSLREQVSISSKFPTDITAGSFDVTGSITAYFENAALYQKFINHQATSLSFRLTDAADNVIVVTLPRVYFTSGNPIAEGADQDILLPLDFTAVKDPVTGAVLQIDML